MTEAVLLVGTKKGLWIGRSDESRRSWSWSDPEFLMQGIYATCIDTRGEAPRMFVGGTSEHFGPGVYRSDDLGHSWNETQGSIVKFPEDLGSSVERVWQIQPGRADDPDVLYAGTQPSALFRSADRGESFELVRSLWDHPHRPDWGAGFGGQAIHTIVPHPDDGQRLTVAMSTGGVYQTADGGEQLEPGQQGHQGLLLPRPVARVRAVRAQGRRAPGPAGTDVRPEPPRRLPVGRRRSASGRRSPTACRRTSASRSSSIRTTRTRSSSSRCGRRRADPARRAGPGLALDRCRRDLDAVDRRPAGPLLRRRHARRLHRRRRATRRACTSARATARSSPAWTTASPGPRSSITCPTCCRSGPRWSDRSGQVQPHRLVRSSGL